VIDQVSPVVDGGRHPVKRVVGEPVEVEATALADGHDLLVVAVVHSPPGRPDEVVVRMHSTNAGLDRWAGRFVPNHTGLHTYRVVAWVDHVGSWLEGTRRKIEAGLDVASEAAEGAALLRSAASAAPEAIGDDARAAGVASSLRNLAARLDAGDLTVLEAGVDHRAGSLLELSRACLVLDDAATSGAVPVDVERELALCSAWYEVFPRSLGSAPGVHGTLADVLDHLDDVADLGFDILYLPPIHPIGRQFRKGPDNAEVAGPDDVGSPWAIGSAEGGHTAVHPDLGTLADVDALVAGCGELGMELALDIALQCSPDHPWVTEHPGWFRHRPDGSIQYAENPPKKYQDIYPLDFECDDWAGLWLACLDIFAFWAGHGVTVFRVDNPHTKPFAFWEWLIAELRQQHPDVVLLSEAFTRPEPMHRLAMAGFTQSYGYFPWRVSAHELRKEFQELASPPSVDRLRPSAWPTTPDILPWHLQHAGREVFALRLVLAATLSPSYGIYGPAFELCDATPAGNEKEEYGASEKYEVRRWDRASPDSLRGLLAKINSIRRDHLALHTLRTLTFHPTGNPSLLAYSKSAHHGPDVDPTRPGDNPVLCVVNLDGSSTQAGMLDLDLGALGVDPGRAFTAHDLLAGETYTWSGSQAYVSLDPASAPAHVLRIAQDP